MAITNITLLASRALLSQAAYGKTEQAGGLRRALTEDAKFTSTQFDTFNTNFELVTTQPNESNGFSATVYRERTSDNTGRLIFATRGTEFDFPGGLLQDFLSADLLGIGALGYANYQAASMYRYWKRLTTPGGEVVAYSDQEVFQLYTIQNGLTTPLQMASPEFLQFAAEVRADVGVTAGQPAGTALIAAGSKVDVVGHSLGGHLAMLFARFFPQNVNSAAGVSPDRTSSVRCRTHHPRPVRNERRGGCVWTWDMPCGMSRASRIRAACRPRGGP